MSANSHRPPSDDEEDGPYAKRPRLESVTRRPISDETEQILSCLRVSDALLERMILTFQYEMEMGLSEHPENNKLSSLIMAPTYVRDLIDGTEKGKYLALDLGGTNFRILLVTIEKGRKVSKVVRNYNVPAEKLTGPATGAFDFIKVFDHLAESIEKFLKEQGLQERRMHLGFTFSFPMEQKDLASATLLTWTKSFQCQGGVDEDVVVLLEEALQRRRDIHVDITAILNDTTGTLMAGNFQDPGCEIGLILGTGSNIAYMEDLYRVGKWTQDKETPAQVIINVEWGAFGDNGCLEFLKTDFDRRVDQNSHHIGSYTFEKLFSGLYMGEVVRCVVMDLVDKHLLFEGKLPPAFSEPFSFPTKYVSVIEGDCAENGYTLTKDLFSNVGVEFVESDVHLISYVCHLVSVRAAKVIAAGISVFLKRLNKPSTTIAVDGSVFKLHPTLRTNIEQQLKQRCPNNECKFILADDGSGQGAAFVAAVATRLRRQLCNKMQQLGFKGAVMDSFCKF